MLFAEVLNVKNSPQKPVGAERVKTIPENQSRHD